MITWVIMGLVAVVVIGVLLWPLFKTPAAVQDRAAYDMTIFQDQLKEVDRDVERGVLTPTEADAARLEIQRRILAADKAPAETHATDSRRQRMIAAAVVAVVVPVIAAGIYLKVGTPGLIGGLTGGAPESAAGEAAENAEINRMITELAAKVEKDPKDVDSAALLARSYAMTGKFAEAVNAFKHLLVLDPSSVNFASYGEAAVYANDGKVNKESHDAFVKALTLDREEPRSRFYLGQEQADNKAYENALSIWRDLVDTAPGDATWLPMVKERMADAAKELNIPVMASDPKHALELIPTEELAMARVQAAAPPAALMPMAPAAPKAPEQMPPETIKMIEGMVGGLAARLEANPSDYDSWLMLGRSYTVLKKFDDAKNAYDKAAALKPGDAEPRIQYMASLMGVLDPAADGPLPQNVSDAAAAVLKLDPKQPDALYVSGLARVKAGDKAGARTYFTQAKATMPADSPLKAYVDRQLQTLDETH